MKIVLLYNKKQSLWFSIASIKKNLIASHETCFKKDKIFHVDYHQYNHNHLLNISKQISKIDPDKIIFLDDSPDPFLLLNALLGKNNKNISYHIFLHGNFTYYTENWKKYNKTLKGQNINFISSSKSFKDLLDFCLIDSNCSSTIPFPIDGNTFKYDEKRRKLSRKKLSLTKNDFIFCYAGRISLQKNIEWLIKHLSSQKKKMTLFIAGNFDDLGAKHVGINSIDGYYFQSIYEIINKYKKRINVRFFPHLNSSKLIELLHATDCYINCSTFDLENFGMGALESLCVGTPCILTNWGGFKNFLIDQKSCTPININIHHREINLQSNDFNKAIEFHMNNSINRHEISKKFRSIFSIQSISQILKAHYELQNTVFKGFNINRLSQINMIREYSDSTDNVTIENYLKIFT